MRDGLGKGPVTDNLRDFLEDEKHGGAMMREAVELSLAAVSKHDDLSKAAHPAKGKSRIHPGQSEGNEELGEARCLTTKYHTRRIADHLMTCLRRLPAQ